MKILNFVLIMLFSNSFFAQDYITKWKLVQDLESKQKIKSAVKEVDAIFLLAKNNKNEQEIIKCFFYQAKYMQTLEEDAQTKIFTSLESTKKMVSEPSKAMLDLVYAQSLIEYYNNNQWQIQNRTNLTNQNNEDFKTWTTKDFYQKITGIYQNLIQKEKSLNQVLLYDYHKIINFNPINDITKRTIYDFTLEQAIDFYVNNDENLNSNQLKNTSKEINFNSFYDEMSFLKTTINFDNERLNNVLKLMQKRESILQDDLQKKEVFWNRLNAIHEIFNEEKSYLETLNSISKDHKNTWLDYEAQFKIAKNYFNKSNKKENIDFRKKALEICNQLIQNKNVKEVKIEAENLKNTILKQSLGLNIQKYVLPNEPILAKIKHQNINNFIIKIYELPVDYNSNFDRLWGEEKIKAYLNLAEKSKTYTSIEHKINDLKDYFEYEKEIILPQLPIGKYLIQITSTSNNDQKTVYAFEEIQATFLNIVKLQSKFLKFEIKNSKTGKPIKDVNVSSNGNNKTTDANGLVNFVAYNNGREVIIKFEKDNDVVFLKDYFYSFNENPQSQDFKDIKITILTDRSIYRLGQVVYFKAIATQSDEEIYQVIPNLKIDLKGKDANGKEIFNKSFTTNEMGSFSGEFILPKDVLTGNFSLNIVDNFSKYLDSSNPYSSRSFQTYFKVEEYKRPKFEVTFETQKENAKLNENVTSKGKAKAYSGNNISDAIVKYSVVRKTQRRWDYWYYRGSQPQEDDETIINGETKTDANGDFSIIFNAKAGNQDPKNNPIYIFEITAHVTDNNGETQSNITTTKVGYNNWEITIEHEKTLESQTKNTFKLKTNNLNGNFVATNGIFTIYKLKSPVRLLLNRPWDAPEIQEINQSEFVKNFPFYPYNNEDKKENWEKGVLAFEKNINTATEKEIVFNDLNKWLSGSYMVEFVIKDQEGKDLKTQSFFDVINQEENKPADNLVFEANIANKDLKKDKFLLINAKTNYTNLNISIEAFHESKSFFKEIVVLENQKLIKIPIEQFAKGNVLIEIDYVVEGQYFDQVLNAKIPHDEPKLSFKINTFRNKLEPGKPEKWSFLVEAAHTPNFAEALATMYDASLDKFSYTAWENDLLSKKFIQNFGNNKANKTFGINYFALDFPDIESKFRNYFKDEINTYGFGIDYSNFYEDSKINELSNYKKGTPIEVSGLITVGKIGKSNVIVEIIGTNQFVVSDKNGNYKIKAKTGDVLRFSYLDLKPIIRIITQKNISIDFNLFEIVKIFSTETNQLEEVAFMSIGSAPIKAKMTMKASPPMSDNESEEYVVEEANNKDETTDSLSANEKVINSKTTNYSPLKIRTNFSETAFFFPHLTTDSKGNINFEFKTPDALTQWKLRLLAHNNNGISAYHEDFAITQKELMVTPNMPRFLREKDTIVLKTKITNLSANAQKGKATLKLFNALDMKPIDVEMQNQNAVQNFEIDANGNTTISWKVFIPNGLQGVQYQVLAQTETHSDGEENILPVLPNTMLVTESKPIWVRENTEKTFTFNNFKDNNSNTLRHHLMTLEYTSNPTWLAIQSLPYLMEYEHECAEQTFARYYANVLATEVINSQPKIKEVFEVWKKQGKPTSKLAQNEELKSIILAETPWLKDMENEAEQRKNLALLFDLEQMKTSTDATLNKLKAKQKSNGAFAWFDGGYDNRYITQHIVSGLGHLNKLIKNNTLTNDYQSITDSAISFLDQEFIKDHEKRKEILAKNKDKKAPKIWTNAYNELHYFYARSFYLQKNPLTANQKTIFKEYLEQIKTQWKDFSLYEKAMAALVLHRFEDKETPQEIITAFKETSSNNEEWGMYWINNKNSWYWYQSSIETQSLIIEAFMEIKNDTQSADLMKVWLLKNKQTKSWSNTKATTEAVYALLLQGSDFMNVENDTKISWGNAEKLNQKLQENPEEVGSGYIKINYKKEEIQPELATLTIKNDNKVPGFGGIYWQYFEELDQIKSSENGPMKMQKELYLKKVVAQDKPAELENVSSISSLKIGDRVVVRIIVSTTEDIDFVHLKDMRASCFEPVDVLSSYQWQNGIGFYKSTKDAATHFFFDTLRKGTFVLEYEVIVNNIGDFSNGISTLQSMYAPEYSHHTSEVRVRVE